MVILGLVIKKVDGKEERNWFEAVSKPPIR